jgi:hypothetical protein
MTTPFQSTRVFLLLPEILSLGPREAPQEAVENLLVQLVEISRQRGSLQKKGLDISGLSLLGNDAGGFARNRRLKPGWSGH